MKTTKTYGVVLQKTGCHYKNAKQHGNDFLKLVVINRLAAMNGEHAKHRALVRYGPEYEVHLVRRQVDKEVKE